MLTSKELDGHRAKGRPRTREKSSAHGYDTKYGMHALRIAHQGRELLITGR